MTTQQKFKRQVRQLKAQDLSELEIARELKKIMFKGGKFRLFNTLRYIFRVGAQVALLLKIEAATQPNI